MGTILASVPIDATDATFERDVIQRSHEQTVVVDFWAAWCGPCRQLTPALEKAVAARGEEMELVKIDTDANPMVSQAFRIQSIPAVKAFRDGKIVDEFLGALPPAQVERFLDGLLPSEAEGLIAAGGEANLRRALELEPGRADALVALARLVDREEALELLANVAGSFAADGLSARLRLEDDAALRSAFAAIDEGQYEQGLDVLIAAIPEAEGDRREDLRRAVVGVLDELGVEHPVARDARRKLASALY
jgi:putative thioredoxin